MDATINWLSKSSEQSPFVQQSSLQPGEISITKIDAALDANEMSESSISPQRDDATIENLKTIIPNTINDTVIIIPVASQDMIWVDNLSCRLSFLQLPNILYWAMDKNAASRLQTNHRPHYYNPILETPNSPSPIIDDAKNKIRLWKWIIKTGTNILYLEPTVALLRNPLQSLTMDSDIEAIMHENSLQTTSFTSESHVPKLGTGVLYLKSTASVSSFLDELLLHLETGKYKDESDVLNAALQMNPEKYLLANIPERSSQNLKSDTRLRYRYLPPLQFINHPIFEKELQLHKSGYWSAFSLRDAQWTDELFYPTLVYVTAPDLEEYKKQRRHGRDMPQESRMVDTWRSLCWWELDSDGICAFLASKSTP